MIIINAPTTLPHDFDFGKYVFGIVNQKPKVNATKGGGILVFKLIIHLKKSSHHPTKKKLKNLNTA